MMPKMTMAQAVSETGMLYRRLEPGESNIRKPELWPQAHRLSVSPLICWCPCPLLTAKPPRALLAKLRWLRGGLACCSLHPRTPFSPSRSARTVCAVVLSAVFARGRLLARGKNDPTHSGHAQNEAIQSVLSGKEGRLLPEREALRNANAVSAGSSREFQS